MKKQGTAQATRRQILVSAAQLVQREGIDALTLDAVARSAGVSKGGLLYHFGGKAQLISGMIEHFLEAFDQAITREEALDSGPSAGRWLRAYVRASCVPDGQLNELLASLLAAIAADPKLLMPLQKRYRTWQARAESDGLDPVAATMVRLALDGLWLADFFGLAPPSGAERGSLVALLLQIAGSKD